MAGKTPELKELRRIAKQLKITTTKKTPENLFEEIMDAIEKGYGSGEFKADHELVVWFNANAPEENGSGSTELDSKEKVTEDKPKTAKEKAKEKAAAKKAAAKEKAAAKKAAAEAKEKVTEDKPKTAKEKAAEAKQKKAEEKEAKKKAKAEGGGRKAPKREGPTFYEDVKSLIEKAGSTKKKGISFEELIGTLQNKWPEKNEASLRNTIAYLKIKGIKVKLVNGLYAT